MLALQIGDEMLELPRGTSLELVEENPFLQFAEDQTLGNYSLPFELNAVNPNIRLTNYSSVIQKIIDNSGIEARLFSNGMQHSIGKVFVEKSNINLNKPHTGKINCFYLFGSSDFYQQIKGRKLRSINVGGDRSFAWDDYATSGPGFWGHITTLARSAPNTDDYAIFPVKNLGWPSLVPDLVKLEWMNMCHFDSSEITLRAGVHIIPGDGHNLFDANRIVPFPYLHYVMRKAVEYAGWTIAGDILNDDDFRKITMLNAQAIDWCYVTIASLHWAPVPRNPVVFNLQENLPDIEIGEFLVAIRKRFGLWYDFDFVNKKITVSTLVGLTNGEVKDVTRFADPAIPKNIEKDKKIYALRNEFAVDGGEAPDLNSVYFQGNLDDISDLPAAAEALYAYVYLVVAENNYYICLQDQDTEDWEWTLWSYNIYDHEQADSNEDIRTAATTVGMEQNDNGILASYIDLAPRLDIYGKWFGRSDTSLEEEWGIHLCFYHGPVANKLGHNYPYGSSHIYDSSLNQVAQWGLPFDCYKTDGTNVGLYEVYWKRILDIISNVESFEATLYLPILDFLNLKFSDRLVIAGVMMFLKQKKSNLEYKERVDIEAVRII